MNEDLNFSHPLTFEAFSAVLMAEIEALKVALQFTMEEPRRPGITAENIRSKVDELADSFLKEALIQKEKQDPAEAARLATAITKIRGSKMWK